MFFSSNDLKTYKAAVDSDTFIGRKYVKELPCQTHGKARSLHGNIARVALRLDRLDHVIKRG